ncbi:hypothetical protein BLNAU_11470 [Blattamonas nauphoetae]|uniref:Uncharacterized protein n=1 Tax=Blattamonas nauphoetae TaxID=2049346 RepID=A0ABQ9XSF4_9EUKA|nr:hypothetical protein BLNAU_11470 [Blattamonas nauphoetae]
MSETNSADLLIPPAPPPPTGIPKDILAAIAEGLKAEHPTLFLPPPPPLNLSTPPSYSSNKEAVSRRLSDPQRGFTIRVYLFQFFGRCPLLSFSQSILQCKSTLSVKNTEPLGQEEPSPIKVTQNVASLNKEGKQSSYPKEKIKATTPGFSGYSFSMGVRIRIGSHTSSPVLRLAQSKDEKALQRLRRQLARHSFTTTNPGSTVSLVGSHPLNSWYPNSRRRRPRRLIGSGETSGPNLKGFYSLRTDYNRHAGRYLQTDLRTGSKVPNPHETR